MSEDPTETGVIIAVLPPGTTYRVRLGDAREILCGTSRDYYGDRVRKIPKRLRLRPKVGDEVLIQLKDSGAIQGLLVRARPQ